MLKLKKSLSFILSLLLIVSMLTPAYAAEPTKDLTEIDFQPLSQEYVDYLALSDTEKANVRMPMPVSRPTSLDSNGGKRADPASIPASYDARKLGYLSPVENQGSTGSCWTFSGTENLETFLNLKTPLSTGMSYDFSPRHLEFSMSSFPNDLQNPDSPVRQADKGGNQFLAMAYFMRGAGPVENTGAMKFRPYPLDENDNVIIDYPRRAELFQPVSTQVLDYEFLPSVDKDKLWESIAALQPLMKQGVIDYGSLDVGVNFVDSEKNLNAKNNCFYNPDGEIVTNHAVLLVGWDDNYPKENFNEGRRPKNNGAWIIQNSWGPSALEGGFYYVSYEELPMYELSTSVSAAATKTDYDNAYVLDPLSFTSSITPESDTAYAANIFKKEAGDEVLDSVSISFNSPANYEIYITDSALSLSGISPVAKGSCDTTSSKTIRLGSPVTISGTSFGVVVKYSLPYGSTIPVEANIGSYYSCVTAPKGSSYLSENGRSWTEISTEENGYSNFCIKAFTTDVSKKTAVSFKNQNEFAVTDVLSADGTHVAARADGSFNLAPNTDYFYRVSEYTENIQPDSSHVMSFTEHFKTDTSSAMTVSTRKSDFPFEDVPSSSWYYLPVKYCFENKIFGGISNDQFAPKATLTRGTLSTLLWRIAGQPEPTKHTAFSDVASGAWYSKAIDWTTEKGITGGVGNNKFLPNAFVTRQDFAAMVYRALPFITDYDTTVTGDISMFTDAGAISNYAVKAMTWCVQSNIIGGRTATTLVPFGNATRGETAAILQRLLCLNTDLSLS